MKHLLIYMVVGAIVTGFDLRARPDTWDQAMKESEPMFVVAVIAAWPLTLGTLIHTYTDGGHA